MSLKENRRPVEVLTEDIEDIGVWKGWHIVAECPDDCADQFSSSIWVYSTMRDKPVRLLDYEIIAKNYNYE